MTSWTEAELRKALDDYERELRMSGKTRNTVATYVQHPERFINWLVGKYSPSGQGASIERQADGPAGGTKVSGHSRRSRYDPLQRYLRASGDTELRMSFAGGPTRPAGHIRTLVLGSALGAELALWT
jgi:hypothetical protein